ncbi:MAG: sugar ABC transporter substrate-binding protein [Microbacterium sp. SCN 70-200]|uniref:ABC transporter substrate-binding protein n=1 Tax=unclassified Microbacterium TaxID=2609290 RepID=UPI000869B838|nr:MULTISPECIES: ABC transporter substrate-binding protein [unclassified Microbacterium]MBN9215323.1 ABC transporter substrate-binding protein [Microbacterium sp.]ODT42722.1 MAG: sugar ABC transporter substrate-binding protein [Microbacterium sp. SCN 70-200]OJV79935.1 MAG: ABC transporter substrate-binding protein [Microbacterium sp. 70-16]
MRKTLAYAALGTAAVITLAGCTAQGAPESTDGQKIEIDFWHGYTEADGKVLDSLVEEFNASQDDIEITSATKPWGTILDTVLPALTSKTGPQLLALPPENIPVYASQGALQPLDDWYNADDSGAAVLNEQAVATGVVSGERFGAPLSFTPLAMFYNKALFNSAGVEVPTTWEEWVTAAKALTVDEDGDGTPEQYGLALADHATVGNGVWVSLFKSGGGDVVTTDGEAVIDSPENAATLSFWSDAVQDDKISPAGLSGVDTDGLFSAGKAAMTLAGPWMASVSEGAGIDYGIAALPAGPAGIHASALAVDLTVTSQASTEERDAIGTFLTWFYQKDNMVTWSLASGWPPLTTEVAAADVSENAVVAALTEQSQYGVALLPGVIPSTDVLAELDTATQKALAGGNPAELLTTAQSAMSAILAE